MHIVVEIMHFRYKAPRGQSHGWIREIMMSRAEERLFRIRSIKSVYLSEIIIIKKKWRKKHYQSWTVARSSSTKRSIIY